MGIISWIVIGGLAGWIGDAAKNAKLIADVRRLAARMMESVG